MKKFLYIAALVSLLSSCAYINNFKKAPEVDYLDRGVKIDIRKFLNGELEGFAVMQDGNGKIIGTETIKISAKWDDNKGVMQQNFIYFDGKKDSRTWLITLEDDGTFSAVGHDVTSAAQGKQIGNAMEMIYTLSLRGSAGKEQVRFVDKIYLVDEKSAIMISDSRKNFGSSGKAIIALKKIEKISDKN